MELCLVDLGLTYIWPNIALGLWANWKEQWSLRVLNMVGVAMSPQRQFLHQNNPYLALFRPRHADKKGTIEISFINCSNSNILTASKEFSCKMSSGTILGQKSMFQFKSTKVKKNIFLGQRAMPGINMARIAQQMSCSKVWAKFVANKGPKEHFKDQKIQI